MRKNSEGINIQIKKQEIILISLKCFKIFSRVGNNIVSKNQRDL